MRDNAFANRLRAELAAQRHCLSSEPQRLVERRWTQLSYAGATTHTGFLQSPQLVADVTDHGVGMYPLLLGGRFFLRLAVIDRLPDGTIIASHPVDDLGVSAATAHAGTATFDLGSFELTTESGLRTRVWVDDELPVLIFDADPAPEPGCQRELVLAVTTAQECCADGYTVLQPAEVPLANPELAYNNSQLPDPRRPTDLDPCVVAISLDGAPLPLARHDAPARDRMVIADRELAGERLQVYRTVLPAERSSRIVLSLGANAAAAVRVATAWRDGTAVRQSPWPDRVSAIRFSGVSGEISDQLPYAVYNSLSARSVTDAGRSIFVHGRRDRGYADAAALHQSYQLHLPALAAGWTSPVREELLAFASLQDERGYLSRQPRPGIGWHHYAGQYSNAHFLLAVQRYLAWTADDSIAEEPVTAALGSRATETLRRRVHRAADWLLHRRPAGLIPPCGWCDAWPPGVVAQGQVSAATVLALRATADLCRYWQEPVHADEYERAAASITQALHEHLYNRDAALLGEHLYADGTVVGDQPDDFWVPTQIWSVLAGVSLDPLHCLDQVANRCLDRGLRAITLTSAQQPYLAASTDNLAALSLDSTMTWLGASWPELTHLYALALCELALPDRALDAVLRQLPARLAAENPAVPAHYYAEKYLYPGDEPWLCTWAGDPTLVEVALRGFIGVRAELAGLRFEPAIPASAAGVVRAAFVWRGEPVTVEISGAGTAVATIEVDGVAHPTDAPIRILSPAQVRIRMASAASEETIRT